MPKAKIFNKTGMNKTVRTKFKIGGRKSKTGAEQMSRADAIKALVGARPRDRQKIDNVMSARFK